MPEDLTVATGGEGLEQSTEPVDAAQQPTEPVPHPDDGDGESDAISAYDVLAKGKPKQKGDEKGDADPDGDKAEDDKAQPKGDKKDDARAKPKKQLTQADFDRALAARLARERGKWEAERRAEVEFARKMARLHKGAKYDDILKQVLASKAEEWGVSAEVLDLMVGDAQHEAQPQPAAQYEPAPRDDYSALAARVIQEETDVKEQYPEFDAREFLSVPENVQRLMQGYSLMDAYVLANLNVIVERERDAGRRQAISDIKSRNSHVPDPSRGSAGTVGKIRVEDLTDAQIAELQRKAKAGQKIRFG